MPYNSTITFTLDTICPWTYLAKRRLASALARVSAEEEAAADVVFTLVYRPYQLYPGASRAGEDKYAWYRRSRYGDDEDKMRMYTTLMATYGAAEGIAFRFGGTIANTLHAHRLIWHVQGGGEDGGGGDGAAAAAAADRAVESLYRQYFEEEKHPSSRSTLLAAAKEAGLEEDAATAFIDDESEGLRETQMSIREQAGNGIDAVPYIVIEGKRRDITLEGCREVEEYVKALRQVIKESR